MKGRDIGLAWLTIKVTLIMKDTFLLEHVTCSRNLSRYWCYEHVLKF